MKKFTKIFFAVAALAVGFVGCTTDTTEDLGVQLGDGAGQTTLTLSLEESRTQLGEKANDLYPVTWSEDDAISVNGVKSSAISISENKSVATFTFNEVLEYPYAIAYPATTAGKVVFADQQAHTEGTFANGAAAMYGYKTAEGGLTLNHLTGVLKIGVTGDKALVMAQISTVDRAPIAGEFALDFATGELTPTTASKELISCTWESESADGSIGFALGATPQYLHFAVPAGEYDELYVTLYDTEGGVMYTTIKADDTKPLNAGKVREFSSDIAYVPNDSVFVIKDVATLKSFAEQAATLEKNALVVADIDMTGVEWTPIEGYAKTVIGNGYAIKGLTAPLFGTTSASIKGLHLEDVVLNSNDSPIMGALACTLTATDEVVPVIEHCSVSGTLTVENTTFAPTTKVDIAYGALVGVTHGANLDECVNNATITVKQLTAAGNETTLAPVGVGGIVGSLDIFTKTDKTILYSTLCNSKNNGAVSYEDISNPAKHRITPYLGGIYGVSRDVNKGIVSVNNANYGDITLASNVTGAYMGGLTGHAYGTDGVDCGSDCVNYGKITYKDGSYTNARTYLGGIVGYTAYFQIDRCHNYGAITMEEGSIIASTLNIGGIAARNTGEGDTYSMNYCTNNAPILIAADGAANTSISFQIGGITGYSQSLLNYCVNNKEGKITFAGDICTNGSRSTQASPNSGSHCLGGVCGYKTIMTMNNNTNHADIIWSGTVTELSTGDPAQLRIGGYQGYGSGDVNGAVCDGDIILSGTFGCEVTAGGVLSYNYGNPGTISSDVDFEVSGTFNGGLILGGVVSVGIKKLSNFTFNGTINVTKDAVIKRLCFIGGCLGNAWGVGTSANACSGHINNGTINVAGTIENAVPRIAGCVAAANATSPGVAHDLSKITNNGAITFSAAVSGDNNLYIGGCAGTVTRYLTTGINNATITFSGNHASNNFYLAGVGADVGEDAKTSENYGDIICTADCFAKNPRVTGVVGYVSDRVTSCINHGNLTYAGACGTLSMAGICHYGTANSCTNGAEGDDTKGQIIFSGSSTGNTHFGGIMRDSWTANASNSTNYGDMHITGASGGSMYIGGCIYAGIREGYTCTNFNNYGDINVSATIGSEANTGADFFIGGLAYACAVDDNKKAKGYFNCNNYGHINVTSSCSVANSMRIGGLIANIESDGFLPTFDSCNNYGDITIAGTSSVHTSGSFCIGGCISNFDNNKQNMVIKGGMKNTGNITLSGENARSSVVVGGVFGTIAADAYTNGFELYLANEGNISVSATAKTTFHIGGVVGTMRYNMAIPMYNTGDITLTGTCGSPADNRIGGLAGSTANAFHGECFCNITAVGNDRVTGMLTGATRANTFAESNSKVGGSICTTVNTITTEEADGTINTITENHVVPLDATNYFNYLYGGTTDWSTITTNYDGATLLSSKDDIVYPSPAVEPAPEEGTTDATTPEA